MSIFRNDFEILKNLIKDEFDFLSNIKLIGYLTNLFIMNIID